MTRSPQSSEAGPAHLQSVRTWDATVSDYEALAEPQTRLFALAAIKAAGGLATGEYVLDVAAGTGAFSLAAATAGAKVLASDFSPAMVARLATRFAQAGFDRMGCEVRVLDGQALALPDGAFDTSASVFGVMLFPDHEAGLRELHRVVRPGGRVIVVVWEDEAGAGPSLLFQRAYCAAFPARPPPVFPPGIRALHDRGQLEQAMRHAGSDTVEITHIQRDWPLPSARWAADNADRLYRVFPQWAALDEGERVRLQAELLAAGGDTPDAPLPVLSRALVAVGRRKG